MDHIENKKIRGIHRQEGDFIILLTKIRRGYTDSKVIS
jgi:hypothetical protein